MFTAKKDNYIMELLKVQELRHYIADTNKGALTLMLRKGESKYVFVLDAVPVEKDVHDELMAVLFPEKEIVLEAPSKSYIKLQPLTRDEVAGMAMGEPLTTKVPKKRGRPFATKKK